MLLFARVRPIGSVLTVGLVLSAAGPGPGEVPGVASSGAGVQSVPAGDQWLARRFTQFVSRFARPGPAEAPESGYRAAVTFLESAVELNPDSGGMLRRLINAHEAAGDEASASIDLLRRLAKLDPDDTVTQMRLIQYALDQRQSVGERLELCERFIDPDVARRLAPSIVSKMAYQVATLRSEQSAANVDRAMLETACRLDPTNLDAAALHMLETDRRTTKHELRAKALMALVKADPTNLAAMSDLEAVLRDAGDYADAATMLDLINDLMSRKGEVLPDDDFARYAVMRAVVDGPQAGYDLITKRQDDFNRFERNRRLQAWAQDYQRRYDDAIAKAIAPPPRPTEIPTFDDVIVALSHNLNSARVLLALLTGNETAIADSQQAFDSLVREEIEKIDSADATSLPDSAVQAMASDRVALEIEQLQVQLWTGHTDDQTGSRIAALPPDHPGVQRLTAWQALRNGQTDTAISTFEALRPDDPLAAVGLGLAYLKADQGRDGARVLADVLTEERSEVLGMWCAMRLEQLLGRPVPMPREGHLVAEVVGREPARLKEMITRPGDYFTLNVEPAKDSLDPMDRMVLNLTVRNDSPWPVAFGPDEILNSRVALFPVITLVGTRVDRNAPPITVDIQRRFMLKPSQSVTVEIDLDLTRLGVVTSGLAMTPVGVEVQAIMDYQVLSNGAIAPAPWSLIRTSRRMTVNPWTSATSVPDLAKQIESPTDEAALFRSIGLLGAIMQGRLVGSVSQNRTPNLITDGDAAMDALLGRWESLSDRARAWSLFTFPKVSPGEANDPSAKIPALAQLHTLAQRDAGPWTTMAWIITRTTDPNDVMLDAAARSDDARLQSLARDVRAFLTRTATEAPAPAPVGEGDESIEK